MKTYGQYLLDTCVCIALIKKVPSVIENIRRVGLGNCKISEITLAELFFGAFKSGKEIDHFDLLIGATALHENFVLVTGNVDHFERIHGLKVENWMV